MATVSGMEGQGQGEQAFLQRMAVLAEAATNAATAAERALQFVQGAQGQAGSSASETLQSGLSAASKILKNPDSYNGDDPHAFAAWKFSFTSWLSFGDGRFQQAFDDIDKMAPSADFKAYSPEEKDMSGKLFAILTSYLRGKCTSLVRSMSKQKDGFRLWRALVQEYEPPSRSRSLAVAQTLATYPSFSTTKTAMENILSYEPLVTQFEELSGATYPEELKVATLIRCSEAKLREHLQLTVTEDTTYAQLKQIILGHDKACKAWTPEAVMKSLQNIGNPSSTDANGPQPMEADRVEDKGKGKKGGKCKGKNKGWWSAGSYGFGRGYGRGRGKGGKGKKGKSKGKNKGKTKSKGKGYGNFGGGKKGGKGKNNNVSSQQCRLCLEYGHWARECPNRMVNQVNANGQQFQQQQGPIQPQQQPFQPSQQQQSYQFPGGSSTQMRPNTQSNYVGTSSTTSTVRRLYAIPMGIPAMSSSSGSTVRMVTNGGFAENVVILDSGSDVSLLPLHFGCLEDDPVDEKKVQLRDCQGGALRVTGYKNASLVVKDSDGSEAELEHCFLVGEVKNCILSLGQLYQNGWQVKNDERGLYLESPDQTLKVPVFYQRNSLAIEASVCRVVEVAEEVQQQPVGTVRAILELEDRFRPEQVRYNQWETDGNNPYMRCIGENFIDPRPLWSVSFKYRTTLIQKVSTVDIDRGWCLVEVSRNYLELDDAFGRIPEVDTYGQGEQVVVLTILSKENEPLNNFGGLVDGAVELEYEPGTPVADDGLEMEIQEQGHEGDDVAGKDIPEFQQIAPAVEGEESEEKVIVGDVEVTAESSVEVLRNACKFLSLSSSGSKTKMFRRIRDAHLRAMKLRALEAARQQYEDMEPRPRFQDAPAQPSLRERKLHEVTRVPFKKWCAFCVQTKSRGNYKKAAKGEEMAERSHPTIQVDFYTMTRGLHILIMVDTWTKFVAVEPTRTPSGTLIGGVVTRFLATLGYFDKVELAFDNEPVLAAGMKAAHQIRANQGLETILQPGLMYDKSRTSLAERTIQTVRAQGKCLIADVEGRIGAKFPKDHVMHAWAMIHGAWLLNRYHMSSSTGVTAHMSLRGRPYKGRVCAFGEEVFALDPLQLKYNIQWRRGVWLGKDEADHDIVAVGTRELVKSKAVRKVAEHWNGDMILGLELGPWDKKRGVATKVAVERPLLQPLPRVHLPEGALEEDVDIDARDVKEYARMFPHEGLEDEVEENPMEEERRREEGGAAENLPRVVEDPKQPKTLSSSPTYAGPLSRPASGSKVRRVVDNTELYDEDDPGVEMPLEAWDWEMSDHLLEGKFEEHEITPEEKQKRGFCDEGRGPPEVSVEELSCLDKTAMFTELERLKKLEVIGEVDPEADLSQAVHLDTKLVRDWRFREGFWTRRSRLVAREFRGGEASSDETFAPTTPLVVVKCVIVIALVKQLALCAMDVSDAFLQVRQQEFVVIEVPEWVRQAVGNPNLRYWQLLKCLPGQRNAALRWNEHFVQLARKFDFDDFQGTVFRHRSGEAFMSVHIDDILLVGEKEFCQKFYEELGGFLKLKVDGPYSVEDPGVLYYLKRQLEVGEDGVKISPNSKYVPKLVEMLNITDRRGKGVPHYSNLNVYDAEEIDEKEYLDAEGAKLFRSALGICLYLAQERLDIQHSVRLLASYMAKPTKTALNGLKKLGSYLVQTNDMKMEFPAVDEGQSVFNRWNGVEERKNKCHFELELFSDSDWATCRKTRRSTSSGLVFLNGCCVHSHSRAQTSIALSSMEAEVLAATGLLAEGIYIKQTLQFLLGDVDGLHNEKKIRMKLYIHSTSAQQFFSRIGPGRAKHLSTRLLWTQEVMRKKWFSLCRIATQNNPADLNTKALSKERREYLMKKIGLSSASFTPEHEERIGGVNRRIAKWVMNVLLTGSLQGCDDGVTTSLTSPTSWTRPTWFWMVMTFCLVAVVLRMRFNMKRLQLDPNRYKAVWKGIRDTMKLTREQDPFCQEQKVRMVKKRNWKKTLRSFWEATTRSEEGGRL